MKRIILIFLAASLALTACGNNNNSKSPEEVVQGFYQALQDRNYDKAKAYLVETDGNGKTSDDVVNRLQKQYDMNSAKIEGFKIPELVDYDTTRKYTSVNFWGTTKTGNFDQTDTMLLIKEGSSWKIDTSSVIKKEPIPSEPSVFEDSTVGEFVTFSDFSKIVTVNGMGITGYIENLLSDRKLIFNNCVVYLETTEGSYKFSQPAGAIGSEKTDFYFAFEGATGEVKELTIEGIYISDSAGNIGLNPNGKILHIVF
ncbi:DUF4878 domain-containing protein [Paenibacillus xylaniclasticus]|uniref:DUF4878 domain-containing protein n=1 Tax=Paenibacillus xylaniclasticus TaxID=588083 RepID=UPI000FDCC1D4|nr:MULTISPECIES: DUF4878 domain-containing protein [Paenibacillus]GFN33951.1 hypothetical protein PCURB6_42110 [Paenibacillus curdlanolyticus]